MFLKKTFDGIFLISDMDGTLLDSQSRISHENRAALENFVECGGLFTIATGRMGKTLKHYLPLLPINVPGILFNGATIYDFAASKILWQVFLSEQTEKVIRDLMVTFPNMGIEVFSETDIYILRQNEVTDKHCVRDGISPRVTPIQEAPFPWIKIILAAEPPKLAVIEKYLSPRQGFFRMVYYEPDFLELLPPQASKGDALKKLLEILGQSDLKVVALGDNLNDLEMLQTADLGIAVANAHPGLRKATSLHYGHHDNHVVAQVIEDLAKKVI
jgi:Cof subfamily protein (haloacid dehalogenase superfamily)